MPSNKPTGRITRSLAKAYTPRANWNDISSDESVSNSNGSVSNPDEVLSSSDESVSKSPKKKRAKEANYEGGIFSVYYCNVLNNYVRVYT